jgi:hypothetical protein
VTSTTSGADDGAGRPILVELLANAVGDTVSGSELVTQYRDLAEELVAPVTSPSRSDSKPH